MIINGPIFLTNPNLFIYFYDAYKRARKALL